MKKTLRFPLLTGLFAVICMTLALSSCTSDDYWYDGPDYTDSRLDGLWQQVQAQGRPVSAFDTQYFDFFGNGRGYYYYYQNGRLVRERINYQCQPSVSGASRYQVNISYENGGTSTINYWFTGGDLWMSWMTNGGTTVTYVYKPISSLPY